MTIAMRAAGALPTSDRGLPTPDPGVGVDTIRLRGPARPQLLHALDEQRVRRIPSEDRVVTQAGWTRFAVGSTEVRVNCNRRTGPLEVATEFSAPKVWTGSNIEALPLQKLPDTISHAVEVLAEQLPGLPRPDAMRLVRLDLVRDFIDVPDSSLALAGLARSPDGRYSQELWSRPSVPSQIQTLARRVNGRWRASCYDKDFEQGEQDGGLGLATKAAGGRLRWEIQLAHRTMHALREKHGRDVDAQRDVLVKVAADHFRISGFDRTYQGGPSVYSALLRELAETTAGRRDAQTITSYVTSVETGVDILTHNTRDRARKLLRRHGLSISDLRAPDGPPSRLNFATGRAEQF